MADNPDIRDLVRKSLDDDESFALLAAHGMLEEAVKDPEFRAKWSAELRKDLDRHRRLRLQMTILKFGALAAGLAIVAIVWSRESSKVGPGQAAIRPPSVQQPVNVHPVLASRDGSQPVVLASEWPPLGRQSPVFRGDSTPTRLPRPVGEVIDRNGEETTVNVGTLDGLDVGTRLSAIRDGRVIGEIKVTVAHRETARGVSTGPLEAGVTVKIAPGTHLEALWERAGEVSATGDLLSAESIAATALNFARSSGTKVTEALTRIGAIRCRAGKLEEAARNYTDATRMAGSGALPWEGLAAVSLLQGDIETAGKALRETAETVSTINNRGVLSEMKGDSGAAAGFYQDALRRSASDSPVRREIERNLLRVTRKP